MKALLPRPATGAEETRRRAGCLWPALAIILCLASAGCEEWSEGGSIVEIESLHTAIGSTFATTLLIPEREDFLGRALVQTVSPPLGVFVFDLDVIEHPLPFDFYDMSGSLQGIVEGLVLEEGKDLAFVTTSGAQEGVWLFDPADAFRFLGSFTYRGSEFELPYPAEDSEGNLVNSVTPTFTSGVAMMGGKVYISNSNFTRVGSNPECAPGTVKIVGLDEDAAPPAFVELAQQDVIVTSSFNPTEVTPLDDRILLVTNTGLLAIRDDNGVPLTEGSVDVVDTERDCIIASYPLGLGAPSFAKIAIAEQEVPGSGIVLRGYMGSAAFNHVYELDLTGLDAYLDTCPDPGNVPILSDKVLAGTDDPIRATKDAANTENLVSQVVVNHNATRAYATGLNSGTLAILALETETDGEGDPLPSRKSPFSIIQATDPLPTQNESEPGPVAVRVGVPGVDYEGPDVFLVTGTPIGELRAYQTY
jgi:hypothetical protein